MVDKKLFYTIPNLTAIQVTEQSPWEYKPDVPETAQKSKGNYREWLARPSTKHCLYSGAEGAVSGLRISRDNPIVRIHGLIADYDTVITEDVLLDSLNNCSGEFRPNFVHKTPNSGGRRLIWLFQSPALVAGNDVARIFLGIAAKKLRAKNFLPGLDLDALANPATYYDVGSKWRELESSRVPENFIFAWLFETGNLASRTDFDGPVIPLDVVQKELEKRFPNRWPGIFDKGISGTRFWDTTSDNPRACVVNQQGTGMQCFTGGTAFMPWVAIFGPDFVEKYKAETLGSVMEGTWFDGKVYWRKTINGQWFPWQKEDYKLYLKVHHQLGASKRPGRSSSETDDVIHAVNEQKVVMGAYPYVYFPDGPITIDHERYLNVSTVQVLPPAPEGEAQEWGQGFPWLANFIDVFFPDQKPREIFLSWLHRAYVNAYKHSPVSGQIVLIAGGVTRGKTLLSTVILSRLLGGSSEAGNFFLGEDTFTDYVMKKPLWTVDDTVPATSSTRHVRYSAMLKKIVANCEHTYNRKFRDAGKIIWIGRVIITCNTDPESIRILPSLDQSNADKISLFRCNSATKFPLKFPDRVTQSKIIDQELPFFARWLLNWTIPACYKGTSRMGVIPYHDNMLLDTATHEGASFGFMEILQLFLASYKKVYPEATRWNGKTTELLSQISLDDGLKPLVANMSSNWVARLLGQLKSKGFPIEQEHTRTRRLWHIPLDMEDLTTEDGKEVMYEKK